MIGVAILDQDPMIRSLLETHVKKVEGYEIIGSMESIEELKQYYRQGKVQLLIGETRGIDGTLVDWIAKLREENHPLDFIKRYFLRNFLRYETVRRDRLYLEALYICEISRGIDAI